MNILCCWTCSRKEVDVDDESSSLVFFSGTDDDEDVIEAIIVNPAPPIEKYFPRNCGCSRAKKQILAKSVSFEKAARKFAIFFIKVTWLAEDSAVSFLSLLF